LILISFQWERRLIEDSDGVSGSLALWQVASAQPGIWAFFTTRAGHDERPGGSFNLSLGISDDPRVVRQNRMRLLQALPPQVPAKIQLLRQVHGNEAVVFEWGPRGFQATPGWWHGPRADASLARGVPFCLGMLFADCLPVYIIDLRTRAFGLIHGGWRGLTSGVMERSLEAMSVRWGTEPGDCVAFLGPAIEREAYEVDEPVLRALRGWTSRWTEVVYPASAGRFRLDLAAAAKMRLAECGIPAERITVHPLGTHDSGGEFFSYRGDGERAGRCAAILWVDDELGGSDQRGREL